MKEIYYPLYFSDFETYQQAVPQFDNLRPYEQIPFQYSLHYQEKEDGELKHKEFLAKEGTDPRQAIAKSLAENMSADVCVMAYNASFEKRFLKYLANLFPEYSKSLMNTHDHVIDLMIPFQRKDIYTKKLQGSYSIKYVLPALVPGLSYDGLEISNGGDASSIYGTLHLVEAEGEAGRIREALLDYCKLDTLAMVELLRFLKRLLNL